MSAAVALSDTWTMGLAGTFRSGEVTSTAMLTTTDGDYYGLTLFSVFALAPSLNLGLSATYLHGNNDINIAGAVGSFDTDVITLAASLSGSVPVGDFTLSLSATASVSFEDRDSYIDSTLAFILGDNNTYASFQGGATLSQTFFNADGSSITPSVGLFGTYNQNSDDAAILVTGVNRDEIGFGATVTGGLSMNFVNGASASVNGNLGLFSDVTTWSVSGNLTIPLN